MNIHSRVGRLSLFAIVGAVTILFFNSSYEVFAQMHNILMLGVITMISWKKGTLYEARHSKDWEFLVFAGIELVLIIKWIIPAYFITGLIALISPFDGAKCYLVYAFLQAVFGGPRFGLIPKIESVE